MRRRFPREAYHQRRLAEIGSDRHKRRLGPALTTRSTPAQRRALVLRVLTHSLMILGRALRGFQQSIGSTNESSLLMIEGTGCKDRQLWTPIQIGSVRQSSGLQVNVNTWLKSTDRTSRQHLREVQQSLPIAEDIHTAIRIDYDFITAILKLPNWHVEASGVSDLEGHAIFRHVIGSKLANVLIEKPMCFGELR